MFVTFLSAPRLPEVNASCYFADARLRSLHAGVHLAPPTALADVIENFSLGAWPKRVSCLQGTSGSSLVQLESWYPRGKDTKEERGCLSLKAWVGVVLYLLEAQSFLGSNSSVL